MKWSVTFKRDVQTVKRIEIFVRKCANNLIHRAYFFAKSLKLVTEILLG